MNLLIKEILVSPEGPHPQFDINHMNLGEEEINT